MLVHTSSYSSECTVELGYPTENPPGTDGSGWGRMQLFNSWSDSIRVSHIVDIAYQRQASCTLSDDACSEKLLTLSTCPKHWARSLLALCSPLLFLTLDAYFVALCVQLPRPSNTEMIYNSQRIAGLQISFFQARKLAGCKYVDVQKFHNKSVGVGQRVRVRPTIY